MRRHWCLVLSPLTTQFFGGRLLSPMLGLTHAKTSPPRLKYDCLRIIFRHCLQCMLGVHVLGLSVSMGFDELVVCGIAML
ncbi:hypothetical protein O987_00055 [Comamonas testosteroni TK102]|uniref:Uncharacterized protein n=1 Tax=Comamonas testosteroni TK102 TaxID=1392005 RepID=A0A076PEW9_COMTE|nr:hypothetical protein O987_00055 [Comamonas testosteroni TK102]